MVGVGTQLTVLPSVQPESSGMEQTSILTIAHVPFPQVAEVLQALLVRPSCLFVSLHKKSP